MKTERDWIGNGHSVYAPHGASNHSDTERQQHDYYCTPPKAVEMLIGQLEEFSNPILEPCCGGGHIVEVLRKSGLSVTANDLYDYGFECSHLDFLTEIREWHGDIITNPPYKQAQEFVEHSLHIIDNGCKVAMFLKLTFLEGKGRRSLFDTKQLKSVYVSRSRLNCGLNGVFSGASAVAYAWFVWEKGFHGDPIVKWFN